MLKINHLPGIYLLLLITACTPLPLLKERNELAEKIAQKGQLTASYIDTGSFLLKTYHKGIDSRTETLHVYIEGDGHAWKRRGQISDDPTPKNPVALRLAARDPSPAVIYIARPCQYQAEENLSDCNSRYWTSHRYSEDVVAAIDWVITQTVTKTKAKQVGLLGYSGGGTIAVLIAARRDDIDWLVTVVGNLDHTLWTDIHNVTPLTGSFNAADFADQLGLLPQMHFVGGKDKVVTVDILNSFIGRMKTDVDSRLAIIQDYDHICCWEQDWPELLCRYTWWKLDYCR
jgi:pimeloyl-ACP methyl ester carboxylesterase